MGLDDGDPFGDCFMFLGPQDEPSSFTLAGTFDADIGGTNQNTDQDFLGVLG
jgi:hypothetical protein